MLCTVAAVAPQPEGTSISIVRAALRPASSATVAPSNAASRRARRIATVCLSATSRQLSSMPVRMERIRRW